MIMKDHDEIDENKQESNTPAMKITNSDDDEQHSYVCMKEELGGG